MRKRRPITTDELVAAADGLESLMHWNQPGYKGGVCCPPFIVGVPYHPERRQCAAHGWEFIEHNGRWTRVDFVIAEESS